MIRDRELEQKRYHRTTDPGMVLQVWRVDLMAGRELGRWKLLLEPGI